MVTLTAWLEVMIVRFLNHRLTLSSLPLHNRLLENQSVDTAHTQRVEDLELFKIEHILRSSVNLQHLSTSQF